MSDSEESNGESSKQLGRAEKFLEAIRKFGSPQLILGLVVAVFTLLQIKEFGTLGLLAHVFAIVLLIVSLPILICNLVLEFYDKIKRRFRKDA